MLIGVGGSGKSTLARFAASISDVACYTPHLRRGQGLVELREQLKGLYRRAGVEGRPVAWLLGDGALASGGEELLEDVNALLNSGDIQGGLSHLQEQHETLNNLLHVLCDGRLALVAQQ